MISHQPTATIRADSGPRVGHGHVMRTLALAEQLTSREGFSVRYAISADSEDGLIAARSHPIVRLPASDKKIADLRSHVSAGDGPLIIDTYDVTENDLLQLHNDGYCVAMIEDGCRLSHYPIDLLSDSAPLAASLSYRGAPWTQFLLGTSYFLLRDEFRSRSRRLDGRKNVPVVVITFGGADESDMTARVLEALDQAGERWKIVAILGASYRGKADRLTFGQNFTVIRQPDQVADHFAAADVAICSAGGTALELSYLGVPMVLIVLADNQIPIAEALSEKGAAIYLGQAGRVTEDALIEAVRELASTPLRRETMSGVARRMIDGLGPMRVAAAVSETWRRHAAWRGALAHE